jgi:aspartate aminotransferase
MPWAGPPMPETMTAGRTRVPVSATLAANEALDRRRRRGEPVLPLAFGEAGLPVLPALREALAAAAGRNAYGPVAGLPELREAVAGYWARRGLPTGADQVICGPGSKPLLFGLLLAAGADVAVPRPSWASYAAQAGLIGVQAHQVPVPDGEGGVCDPGQLAAALAAARAAGSRVGSVIVTLPDNPTGRLARPATIRALCDLAAENNLVIISDEIYADLVHDPATEVLSPAAVAPGRTVVTTALSKSLALGGWRIGAARLPDGPLGEVLRDRLLGIGSEIWSAPSAPIQQAAAFAFSEPPEITDRIARSRCLHARLARAVADRLAAAGVKVPSPQAAFYLYPDFETWREHLHGLGIGTAADLAAHLLDRYGAGVLPGSAFGDDPRRLRLRLATGLLYGESEEQREAALAAGDPLRLPWIAAALTRIEDILADLSPARTVPASPLATGPAATGPAATGPAATSPLATGPAATGPAATQQTATLVAAASRALAAARH